MKLFLSARVLVWPVTLILILSVAAAPAYAQSQPEDKFLRALEKRDRIIRQLIDRVNNLERQVQDLKQNESQKGLNNEELDRITGAGDASPAGQTGGSAPPAAASAPNSAPAAGPAGDAGQKPASQPSPSEVEEQVKEAKAEAEKEKKAPRVPLASVEQGGNLLRPGQIQFDTSFQYVHNVSTRLIFTGFSVIPLVILGTLESEKVRQDAYTTNLGVRYGLMKDVQVGFRLPISSLDQSTVRLSSDQVALAEDGAHQTGIGDLQFTATYQPLYERNWWPAVNVSLRVRAPTGRSQFDIYKSISRQGSFSSVEDFVKRLNEEGLPIGSGFWSLTPTVSFVKGVDPGILFGSIGYSFNIPRTVTLVQINGQTQSDGSVLLLPVSLRDRVDPGDSVNFSLGLAVALNNQLSFNFSFSDSVVFTTRRGGQKVVDSNLNAGQLNLGFVHALTRHFVVDFSGSVGLTPDAPDMAFTLGVPVTFDSLWDLWPFRRTAG